MSGYITMDKDLEEDPRTDDLGHALYEIMGGRYLEDPDADAVHRKPIDERLLGVCRSAIIGGLYKLWRHGDGFLGRHDRLKSVTLGDAFGASHVTNGPRHAVSRSFARIAEVTALPASLLKIFPEEWLRIHDDGSIELPGYSAKNRFANRDLRREKGRDRTRRWREKNKHPETEGDASHAVTSSVTKRHGDGVPRPSQPIPIDKTPLPPKGDTPATQPVRTRSASRQAKDASKAAFVRVVMATAKVRAANRTWADVLSDTADDPSINFALTAIGDGEFGLGCRLVADADKFTRADIEERFRSAYEVAAPAQAEAS
jgi:hypothetical protein